MVILKWWCIICKAAPEEKARGIYDAVLAIMNHRFTLIVPRYELKLVRRHRSTMVSAEKPRSGWRAVRCLAANRYDVEDGLICSMK